MTKNWNCSNINIHNVYRLPIRNWNFGISVVSLIMNLVYRLPIRNWNNTTLNWNSQNLTWVYRLPIRNWNPGLQTRLFQLLTVYRLPIRNWNHPLSWCCLHIAVVYRLPIRNWNIVTYPTSSPFIVSILAYLQLVKLIQHKNNNFEKVST